MDIDMTTYYTTTHPDWETWKFPEGPWGWNPDGTSRAPSEADRLAHVNWYHDTMGLLEDTNDPDTEWLERLEAHIADEIGHYGLDTLEAWQDILDMATANIDLLKEEQANGNG